MQLSLWYMALTIKTAGRLMRHTSGPHLNKKKVRHERTKIERTVNVQSCFSIQIYTYLVFESDIDQATGCQQPISRVLLTLTYSIGS